MYFNFFTDSLVVSAEVSIGFLFSDIINIYPLLYRYSLINNRVRHINPGDTARYSAHGGPLKECKF